MKFEEVIPALREGKKVRRSSWNRNAYVKVKNGRLWQYAGENPLPCSNDDITYWLTGKTALFFDWEIVKETKKFADYLVRHDGNMYQVVRYDTLAPTWVQITFEIGTQPEGAVLIPGSEREEEV